MSKASRLLFSAWAIGAAVFLHWKLCQWRVDFTSYDVVYLAVFEHTPVQTSRVEMIPRTGLFGRYGVSLSDAVTFGIILPSFLVVGTICLNLELRKRALIAQSKCHKCGYQLPKHGASAPCPECGTQPS